MKNIREEIIKVIRKWGCETCNQGDVDEILKVILENLPKEKKVKWDNPQKEISDTDYKLGEKIGYNQALQEAREIIKKI